MSEIIIRRLAPNEAKKYRAIRLVSLKAHPKAFCSSYEEQVDLDYLGFERSIETKDQNRFVLGAFDQDELIGICGFSRSKAIKIKHQGEIVQMYVAPNHQGKKIGKQLLLKMMEILENMNGLSQVTLGVEADNLAAFHLYKKLGFKEFGLHKGYIKLGNESFDMRFMIKEMT